MDLYARVLRVSRMAVEHLGVTFYWNLPYEEINKNNGSIRDPLG